MGLVRCRGNPAWIDTDEPGNDSYQGTLDVPAPGSYDLAYRFSRDGGSTWLYCDRDAGEGSDGSENGYQVERRCPAG
ncbi:MAG: hypothetical protein U5M50_15490, partial [Sphingobium sp.]|nr:hypothetical protein [Sphingobium sp.]